jgi:hypothetical protein
MRKIRITLILFLLTISFVSFAQLNPIKNLSFWQSDNFQVLYDCLSQNCFSVSWNKPNSSFDTLVGYKVYRNDILFAFSTDTVVECTGSSPCYYPGFFENIFPCWVTVKAIYNHDSLSSIADDSIYVDGIAIGIKKYNRETFNLFPNPTSDKFTITFTASQKQTLITIFNIQGQLIKQIPRLAESKRANPQSSVPIEIDVSALAKGIYIVKVQSENGITNKKLIIQ